MKRLQSSRSWMLPLLLGALVLRAMIPPGYMPAAHEGAAGVAVQMCRAQAGKSETLEIPGALPDVVNPSCEYCVAPLLGAPLARLHFDVPRLTPPVPAPLATPQISQAPLVRAQTARAPPPAA